jgi:hypothetical protein
MLILQLTVIASTWAGPITVVGFIESFDGPVDGPEKAYTLKREEKECGSDSIKFFVLICEGDQIVVNNRKNYIKLNIRGRVEGIGHGYRESSYNVEKKGKSLSLSVLLTNLMSWARDPFTRWHGDELRKVNVYVRGDEDISIPLLEDGGTLAAGARPFYLGWKGGKPPYRIQIYRQYDNKPLFERDLIQENRVRLENLTLSQGNYGLNIRDADNREAKANFSVLASNQLPSVLGELRQSRLPETVKNTLSAAWLAGQDHGKWVFESYQRAAAIADTYYPARLLRNALEDGERPVFNHTP